MLLALHVDEELAEELQTLRAPVVLIGNEYKDFDSFHWDNISGARSAVNHLINQGHERIGFITSPFDNDSVLSLRKSGYLEILESANKEVNEEWIVTGKTEKHAELAKSLDTKQ